MDGDPAVEPELDTFSLILPLPYRVAVILVLGMVIAPGSWALMKVSLTKTIGVWAWAVNLHYLFILKIVRSGGLGNACYARHLTLRIGCCSPH